MYLKISAKLQINVDAHGKVMSDIGIKQECLPSPTLFARLFFVWLIGQVASLPRPCQTRG